MDRRVIADKLERLRRCVQRIEHKRPSALAALAADVDLQDILSVPPGKSQRQRPWLALLRPYAPCISSRQTLQAA